MVATATGRKSRRKKTIIVILCVLLIVAWQAKLRFWGATPLQFGVAPDAPAELATWPWPHAKQQQLTQGVTHWSAQQGDGTIVELLRYDFKANPHLRFGLYDQDSDDAKPWDNQTYYNNCGVGEATRRLNQKFGNTIISTWNGPFFGYLDGASNPRGRAHHVAPVAMNGKLHHWGTNHRWTFGVEYSHGNQQFKLQFLPSQKELKQGWDWASGGLQCLMKDGKSLKLQPFPKAGDAPLPQPFPSTQNDVGHIPHFDHMRSSRASFGWTKDSSRLYVLWVKEPDNESASIWALNYGWPLMGGWTIADVQRFWLHMRDREGVTNVVNSDAGNVLQYTFRKPNGKYDLVPPRGAWVTYERAEFDANFENAPAGGALMYFYVREEK